MWACVCGVILSQVFLKLKTNSPWVRPEDQRGLELGDSFSASIKTRLWWWPFPEEGPFLEELLRFHSGDFFPPSASFLDLHLEIPADISGLNSLPHPSAKQEMQVWSLSREDPLGKENGNPLHYSWLENPMDRGAWWATVHGVAKSQTWLSDQAHTHTHTHTHTHSGSGLYLPILGLSNLPKLPFNCSTSVWLLQLLLRASVTPWILLFFQISRWSLLCNSSSLMSPSKDIPFPTFFIFRAGVTNFLAHYMSELKPTYLFC